MKIIDYMIVRTISLSSLVEQIHVWLGKGWQPLGSPGPLAGSLEYYQAMVRYEEPPTTLQKQQAPIKVELPTGMGTSVVFMEADARDKLLAENKRLRETVEWACVTAADTALWRTELRRRVGLDEAENNRLREGKAT